MSLISTIAEYLFVPSFVLAVIVSVWRGTPAPWWLRRSIDGIALLFCAIFIVGIVIAIYTGPTETKIGERGFRLVWSAPEPSRYFLAIIIFALFAASLYGAWFVVVAEYKRYSAAMASGPEIAAAARKRAWGIAGAVLGAVVAAFVTVTFGDGLRISTDRGYENVWPFVVQVIGAVIFITAILWLWRAAKAILAKP